MLEQFAQELARSTILLSGKSYEYSMKATVQYMTEKCV